MAGQVREYVTRADRAGGGLAVDLGLYAFSAIFALATAVGSTLAPHRTWGWIAVYGYTAAALAVLAQLIAARRRTAAGGSAGFRGSADLGGWAGLRGRAWLAALTWVATALLPLAVEAMRGQAQEEVVVIERAGQRLLDTGTPYLGRAAVAALPADERLLGYVPYQPGMALFGLPRALAGGAWWADARVWFAIATIAVLATAVATLQARAEGAALVRAAQAVTVLPICALTVATGGDDLPVLALCLLALAFTARGRLLGAGVAIGLAGALKLFAWPVALVLLVVAVVHRRPARYALPAFGLPIAAVLPAVAVDTGAALENLVRFPLGHGLVASPAASPFPGHLIAAALPGGRVIASAMLVAAGLAIGWWLLRRPPRDAGSAALACAYGLTAAIALMPATRFGYLLYPLAYLAWRPALRASRLSESEPPKASRPPAAWRTQGG
jgi:hypothetical protein